MLSMTVLRVQGQAVGREALPGGLLNSSPQCLLLVLHLCIIETWENFYPPCLCVTVSSEGSQADIPFSNLVNLVAETVLPNQVTSSVIY